jgi:uncharacterized damage-inducible protein DinB
MDESRLSTQEILSLFDYNEWANARFVGVIAALGDDQLTARLESSFPSILGTLGHMVAAEWVWLRRWKGDNPTAFPEWLESPRLGEVRSKLAEVESERRAFLESLEDADLDKPVDYRTLSGAVHSNRLVDLCRHVVNHSSYHRGQLTTLLRQVGATPVSTDFIVFLREA